MILITGGTGSFGSAYISTLQDNEGVIVYSRDWQKHQKVLQENPTKNIISILGDIRDKDRLREVFNLYPITKVIHAAAIKDIVYCENNPTECLKTNVIGTQNLIDVIKQVDMFIDSILISTDKAVMPINTYGVSKKMAEKLWITANDINGIHRFSVCRYGNVVGSSGSVVPLYKKLIKEGATSLPVTDIRCTRFHFLMKNAIDFVKYSLTTMKGGEMFIPKIPSVRIVDICEAFKMPYHIIGLRNSEKIHEYMTAPSDIDDSPGYSSGNNPHFLTVEEIRGTL